ncbi:MAG: hypothetical protein LBR93_02715 [Treponema sp.]|jgi:hypothetical protein|nr:hypothetical protein [Treponema sp.]
MGTRQKTAYLAVLCAGLALFGGCKDLFHLEEQAETPVQYIPVMPENLSLNDSLAWIRNNAVEGSEYTITVKNNETIAPRELSYDGKKVNVILKGETTERIVILSKSGSLFTLGSGVTLTLDNNITLWGLIDNTASLVQVNSGGTLVMKDGSKINENKNTSSSGGGVHISGGEFTMGGGTISGNTSSFGGGVYISGGEFTMSGGTISGNASSYGGGVSLYDGGEFTMNGGTISGNTSSYGGGVYVSSSYGTFTKQSGGVICGSDESDSSLRNTASGDSFGHGVYAAGSSTRIRTKTAGTEVTLDSSKNISQGGGWDEETDSAASLSLEAALTWLAANAAEGGAYTIMVNAGETIAPQILSYSSKNVHITLKGGTAERIVSLSAAGSLFTLEDKVTLTLDNNITLQGLSDNTASLVQVNSGGKLVMNTGSKICGNTSSFSYSSYGGGVYVSGGTFTMSGGTISGNTSTSYGIASSGGGVYVDFYGTFIKKKGGIIYGSDESNISLKNTASYGHVVYVSSSPAKKRDKTAGEGVKMDSTVSGPDGGWE